MEGRAGAHGAARFDGEAWTTGPGGAPFLDPALCSLDRIVGTHQRAGSLGIFVGRVVAARRVNAVASLLNSRGAFRALDAA